MKQKLKRVRGSGNIFVDLGFDKAEAENLKLRSELMMCIEDYYRQRGMTQAAAAKALGQRQDWAFQPRCAGEHRQPSGAERAAGGQEGCLSAGSGPRFPKILIFGKSRV